MKKTLTILLGAATILAAMLLNSCTGRRAADVCDVVSDKSSAIRLDFLKLGASAGVSSPDDLQGLSADMGLHMIEDIITTDGVELSDVAAIRDESVHTIFVVPLTSPSAAEKSLQKKDYNSNKTDGVEVFTPEGRDYSLLIDGTYLWLCPGDGATVKSAAATARTNAKSSPLKEWKRRILQADNAVNLVTDSAATVFGAHVNFEASTMKIGVKAYRADGADVALNRSLGNIDAASAAMLNPEATLSFAVGPGDYRSLLQMLERMSGGEMSRIDTNALIRIIRGPLAGYVNLGDVKAGGSLFDMGKSLTAALNIGMTDEDTAARYAQLAVALYRSQSLPGMSVSGTPGDYLFTAPMGLPSFSLKTDGPLLCLSTVNEAPKGERVDFSDGTVAYISFNIPKTLIGMMAGSDLFGLKGHASISCAGVVAEVSLSDTEMPFLAAFIQLAASR